MLRRKMISLLFSLSLLPIVSCGSKENKSKEASPQAENPNVPNPEENGATPQPEFPVPRPDAVPEVPVPPVKLPEEDLSHLNCRVEESDGKKYCFDPRTEFPSDLDPTKKVKKCEFGMLDHETCKPLSFVFGKGFFKIYAGDVLRADGRSVPKKVQQDGKFKKDTFKLEKLSFRKGGGVLRIVYDYPTFFDKTTLDSGIIPNIEFTGKAFRFKHSDDQPQIYINYQGVSFKTGAMKLEEFETICNRIKASEHTKKYPWHVIFDHTQNSYRCGIANGDEEIALFCDSNDQHCRLNELALPYYNSFWWTDEEREALETEQ